MRQLNQQTPKLVIVEGIMGAGKSTTAKYIESYLHKQGIKTHFFSEGDLDHPADFEYVACLSEEQFQTLKQNHKGHAQLITDIAIRKGIDYIIYYGKEHDLRGDDFPLNLYHDIEKFDIYNGLPLDKHRALLQKRWQAFVDKQVDEDTTVIFECCFLQNPMCKFMAQHNAGEAAVTNHLFALGEIIKPLNPLIVYMKKTDIAHTIMQASKDRSKEWLELVIRYHTEQAYGKEHGLEGFDGFVQFLTARQSLELDLCRRLPLSTLIVDDADSDWQKRYDEIALFLNEAYGLWNVTLS